MKQPRLRFSRIASACAACALAGASLFAA